MTEEHTMMMDGDSAKNQTMSTHRRPTSTTASGGGRDDGENRSSVSVNQRDGTTNKAAKFRRSFSVIRSISMTSGGFVSRNTTNDFTREAVSINSPTPNLARAEEKRVQCCKYIMMCALSLACAALVACTWILMTRKEEADFHAQVRQSQSQL